MKRLSKAIAVVIMAAAVLSPAKDKPAIEKENLAKLQAVKTIFVDGNNESADKVRQHLESWTCLKLAGNKATADAVMVCPRTRETQRHSRSGNFVDDNTAEWRLDLVQN
jgi:hypothetical protein